MTSSFVMKWIGIADCRSKENLIIKVTIAKVHLIGGKMISTLIGKELTDIYTVGFIYLYEDQKESTPDLRWIYFESGDVLVEFESFEQYSRLRMERVPDIRYRFEYDEDMIKVRSSIKGLVLVSSMLADNTVKEIELKDGSEKDCAVAKITLENGQMIFLDPGFPYGIGIGGQGQERYWCLSEWSRHAADSRAHQRSSK